METTDPRPIPRPRIAVLAAETGTGEAVARDAVLRGMEVLCLAQQPERVARVSPAQQILALPGEGEPEALASAIADAALGADAAILALEPEPGVDRTELVTAALRALRAADVRRVVASSSLLLRGGAHDPVIDTGVRSALGALKPGGIPRSALLDLRHAEILLEMSGLDWTILRAGSLTDQLGTRRPRLFPADTAARDASARSIAREDVARALLDQAVQSGAEPRVQAVAEEA